MKIVLLSLAIVTTISSFAQNQHWCKTDEVMEQQKLENLALQSTIHQGFLNATLTHDNTDEPSRATIFVPTVVHIIHDNGIGNISIEQVDDALRILNEDYNRQNADATDTRNTIEAPFAAIAGDMDVQFKLARIDPDGNCTNGIVRLNAPDLTYDAGENCKDPALGGSGQWPMDRYLNIWVVNSINSIGEGTTLGYAFYPYGALGNTGYGVLIRNDAFGTIETAQGADGRTLTHELGHALGLAHIFQGGCLTGDCSQEGDYCCDTPPQAEANWSCSQTWNSCNQFPPGSPYGFDTYDQIENYMSYNACQNMFTQDQVNIMQNNFQNIGFLANMVTPANIASTGINEPDQLCSADFSVDKTLLCPGDQLSFSDESYNAATGWTWTFEGGTPASSTDQNPTVTYNTPGTYAVTLVATDGTSTDTEVRSSYITVLDGAGGLPFFEDFEGYNSLTDSEWKVDNPDGEGFEIYTGTGHTGNKCVRLNNFGEPADRNDELLAPIVDLSGVASTDPLTLSFRYSYKRKNTSSDEWLKLFVSNNCGETWSQRKTLHGTSLSSDVFSSAWTPSTQEDWTTVHVTNITSIYRVENFRYKFKFESDAGNNMYLDNINIYEGEPNDNISDASLQNNGELVSDLLTFPNPTENELNIRFNIQQSNVVNISVKNLAGQELQSTLVNANSGSNIVLMDVNQLSQGMYFLELRIGGATQTIQFMVK